MEGRPAEHQIGCIQVWKSQGLLWGRPCSVVSMGNSKFHPFGSQLLLPKKFAFEVQDTCQLDLGWPELCSVVSKEPQETEPGLLTICLSYWQGCDVSSKGS